MRPFLKRITIACELIEDMKQFYCSVLDCDFEKVENEGFYFYASVLEDNLEIVLFPANIAGVSSGRNRHQLRFIVKNAKRVFDKATSCGGKLVDQCEIQDNKILMCLADPEGNTIEFIESKG